MTTPLQASALATAHHEWDRRWQEPENQDEWLVAEPSVIALAARLRLDGAERALDLGCGLGRHALALARLGFHVDAIDGSDSGLRHLAQVAGDLPITTHQADFRQISVPAARIDLVVCWNVIYHGTRDDLALAVAGIARVLRPGGTLLATLLSKRNHAFGRGEEIAHDTWIDPADAEKAHAHCYCDAHEVTALLAESFSLRSLIDVEHRRTGSWHWHVVAERT